MAGFITRTKVSMYRAKTFPVSRAENAASTVAATATTSGRVDAASLASIAGSAAVVVL